LVEIANRNFIWRHLLPRDLCLCPFSHSGVQYIAHNHSFFNHHDIYTRHHYIPKHGDRQHDTMAISDTKHKMDSEETYGDRLHTLLEEARAANKIGENRKPLPEFLIDFERKQKAFEDAQRQKFEVSGASSDSSTLTLIQQLINLADHQCASLRERPAVPTSSTVPPRFAKRRVSMHSPGCRQCPPAHPSTA
jgi:hypothetical protein